MSDRLSLLGAYGHPDDEQGVSGLMHKYAKSGVSVTPVCATRGEVGEIAPGVDATPQTLGQVREEELRCRHKPQVMLTFDPDGGYGHSDHVKIHQAAMIAYFVAGDARIFPEQLAKEDLQPWTPLKLYWGVFSRSRFQQLVEMAKRIGVELPVPLQEFARRGLSDEVITTRVDVSDSVDPKLNALYCHASQLDPNSIFAKIPPEIRKEGLRIETLIRAESRVAATLEIENDLFVGIN